jgi:hypothetical protein
VASLTFATASAQPGHDRKMMGTIVSIDGRNVLVKTTDGHERSFALTDATKSLNGKKKKGDVKDLKAGIRIVVNVGDGEERLKAKELQYALTVAK